MSMSKTATHLIIAAFLSVSGVALLFLGALIPPKGTIDPSLLVAFGEVATFAGAVLGIDYKSRINQIRKDNENQQ